MKLIRLTGILGVLALAACDAGIEPIDQRIRTLDEWDTAEWAAYAEGLRAYKAGDHYVTCVCFDNAPERIESEKNCIRSLPDSLDGLAIRYSGAVTAAASSVEAEVARRLGALTDKTLVFEGNASFIAAANRGLYDLYLLDATSASDIFAVENAVDYLAGYYGIEPDRILPLVPLTGTIADESGISQPATDKLFEMVQSRSLCGLAFGEVSGDYYSQTGNYPQLRAAIDLLNPAHQ